MDEMRFHIREESGKLFRFRAWPKFQARPRMFNSAAIQRMMVEQRSFPARFEDVLLWCHQTLTPNQPAPWWVYHRDNYQLFFLKSNDAMAFRMRWC